MESHTQEPHSSPADRPMISVIVPVLNEAPFIERLLDQLVRQQYSADHFEVLVIDGGSTDGTPERVGEFGRRHPNVRLLRNPRRLASAARNVGVRHSRGEIVMVIDGHCEIEDDRLLERLANAFRRSGADCIGRPQPLEASDGSAMQRAIGLARGCWLGHHPDSHIYSDREGFVPAKSVAVAYRRTVFDRVGRFDERFDACEDVEFNHRIDAAGLRCFFTPEVAVRYVPRASLRGLFRQMGRYGRGRIRLLRKHRETASLKTLAPGLFVAGVAAGPGLPWLAQSLTLVWAACIGLYLAVILAMSFLVSLRSRSPAMLVLLPAVFATIHVGCGVGLLVELLRWPLSANFADAGRLFTRPDAGPEDCAT